jgi:hypothetical protein
MFTWSCSSSYSGRHLSIYVIDLLQSPPIFVSTQVSTLARSRLLSISQFTLDELDVLGLNFDLRLLPGERLDLAATVESLDEHRVTDHNTR